MITNFNSSVDAKILQTGKGSEAEMDVSELHSDLRSSAQSAVKSPSPAMARAARENPRVANFQKRRAYRVAANGGSHPDASSMGSTPQKRPVIYPIKDKTQSGRRSRKYREHEGKGCVDKFRYPNHAEAHEAIRGIIRKPGKKKFRSLKSYQCSRCRGWHIHST